MNKNNPAAGIIDNVEGAAGHEPALFTDLYELTMLQAYFQQNMMDNAVFTLFFRRLPSKRNFLLACGLDTILDYLENMHFSDESIAYLRSLDTFSKDFLTWLSRFRFTGEVRAVAEGTPVFPNEPILEVIAPIPQAQLAETFIMNQIHLQTILASKAWRLVKAAQGRPVVDFGARRMHGTDAALKAARAFHIAGTAGTSNVLAGKRYNLPVKGTMAHSYIQAHEDESSAFRAFTGIYPGTVLLVDTYDTMKGIHKVIELSKSMGSDFQVSSVRLDSGDLLELSKQARKALDEAGLNSIEIFVSGGLDEYAIEKLLLSDAPIDGFGVGTSMGVSEDAPSLDIAYKLSEYAGKGKLKLSSGKPILPGQKQIFRAEENGRFVRDIIGRHSEKQPGKTLLQKVMKDGKKLPSAVSDLEVLREYASNQTARLPEHIKDLQPADQAYQVQISSALSNFQKKVEQEVSS